MKKLLEVDRFDDVRTAPQLVHRQDLLFIRRRGQDNDGYPVQVFVLHHLGKHFAPVHSGHIQIEEDQVRGRDIPIRPLLAKESQAFFTVF
jgi:hypothetical protein